MVEIYRKNVILTPEMVKYILELLNDMTHQVNILELKDAQNDVKKFNKIDSNINNTNIKNNINNNKKKNPFYNQRNTYIRKSNYKK